MGTHESLTFDVTIRSPRERVWAVMLGPETYREWTAPFFAGSYYEGAWSEGSRIRFLTPSGEGMVAEVAVCRPPELVSLRHIGRIHGGIEDTESAGVRSWAPAFETYALVAVPEGTRVEVRQDAVPAFASSLEAAWPAALDVLRRLCETPASSRPAEGP
ncbi:MAG: SRPBCC domain-containing protein [Rubricoccaceae bacterium]|nr:SRPBCC domain-containing protein [Rubricoccaceae bacterium]